MATKRKRKRKRQYIQNNYDTDWGMENKEWNGTYACTHLPTKNVPSFPSTLNLNDYLINRQLFQSYPRQSQRR
jgi:hypothetical protein